MNQLIDKRLDKLVVRHTDRQTNSYIYRYVGR